MSVRSFVFNDSQDQELPNWTPPDYDKLTSGLKGDIFALPSEVASVAGRKSGPRPLTTSSDGKEDLPSWTKHIQFNGISRFGDKNFAMFYNKSNRSTFTVAEGEKITDTDATVVYIDAASQKVVFEENGENKTLKLRTYGDISEFLNRPFSFQYDLEVQNVQSKAKAIMEIKEFETQAELYQLNNGKPITALSDLYPEYLKEAPGPDPWGNEYVVTIESDGTVRVTSSGVTSDETEGKAGGQTADWGK